MTSNRKQNLAPKFSDPFGVRHFFCFLQCSLPSSLARNHMLQKLRLLILLMSGFLMKFLTVLRALSICSYGF